jgi:hypothetical protein
MWQHRFDLIAHLERQRKWSEETFGPFTADKAHIPGVIDHLREEIGEVEKEPTDVTEWIDVMILAMDGAMRMGFSPHEIAEALCNKQTKNESRKWPDWRTQDPGKKIKALKSHEHEMQTDIEEGVPARCRVSGCDYSE